MPNQIPSINKDLYFTFSDAHVPNIRTCLKRQTLHVLRKYTLHNDFKHTIFIKFDTHMPNRWTEKKSQEKKVTGKKSHGKKVMEKSHRK